TPTNSPPPTPPTQAYTLPLHDALPILRRARCVPGRRPCPAHPQPCPAAAVRPGSARTAAQRQSPHHRAGRPRDRLRRGGPARARSEEHTSELQSRENLVCRLLLEKKNK